MAKEGEAQLPSSGLSQPAMELRQVIDTTERRVGADFAAGTEQVFILWRAAEAKDDLPSERDRPCRMLVNCRLQNELQVAHDDGGANLLRFLDDKHCRRPTSVLESAQCGSSRGRVGALLDRTSAACREMDVSPSAIRTSGSPWRR